MRLGPGVDDEFRNLEEWGPRDSIRINPFPTDGGAEKTVRSNALSGGERNRLFLKTESNYKDVSLVSGIDFREDGRGFVVFDYDKDGWLDLGITSPNRPRFRIARNRLADFQTKKNGFVEIQLVGGQTVGSQSEKWSPRDPYGATVIATIGNQKRAFQLSCGEGLSVQNANRIHVGLGQAKQIDELKVIWPSGRESTRSNVSRSERITISENEINP